MKKRTPILLAVMILLPISLLAWYGVRDQQNQQLLLQHQFSNLIENQLRQVDQQLQNHFFALQGRLIPDAQQLEAETAGSYPANALRDYLKSAPQLQQLFVLSSSGERIFPPRNQPLDKEERAFVTKTQALMQSPELFVQQPADALILAGSPVADIALAHSNVAESAPAAPTVNTLADGSQDRQLFSASLQQRPAALEPVLSESRASTNPHGWIVWYADTGLQHIFWWQDHQGTTLGFSLNSARLLSDLINLLPSSEAAEELGTAEIQLINNRGEISYAWGNYQGPDAENAQKVLPLSHPLGSWRIAYHAQPLQLSSGDWYGLMALLLLLTGGLSALGYLLYREHSRELRLAEQRVNFVNQVSHELKTPLTNVRLYAEMLENQLPAEERDPLPHRYLSVIASESQRLSRLIENVLSFSRLKRGMINISLTNGVIDERIRQIIHNFTPALADRNLHIQFDDQANNLCQFDPEALEQILNNLISNCEKYAAGGETIEISSWQQDPCSYVRIKDHGPGIPASEATHIFTPFYRISHRLTDGITGTGIGLGLARDLARAHQGELCLEAPEALTSASSINQNGASFLLTLSTPTASTPQ